nr:putative uncharacterized transmembrane protein DDB_G0293028 isoform X2 [Ipomoea batatas]
MLHTLEPSPVLQNRYDTEFNLIQIPEPIIIIEEEDMSMRSLALRTGLRGLMEGTPSGAGRSSVSGLRYFSDSTGRILSEEERAKENVYIQIAEEEAQKI